MLIDKINNNQELLERFSALIYFMNKEVAKRDFMDFLEYCEVTLEEWDVLAEWLNENGLKTYN